MTLYNFGLIPPPVSQPRSAAGRHGTTTLSGSEGCALWSQGSDQNSTQNFSVFVWKWSNRFSRIDFLKLLMSEKKKLWNPPKKQKNFVKQKVAPDHSWKEDKLAAPRPQKPRPAPLTSDSPRSLRGELRKWESWQVDIGEGIFTEIA